jgi:hypothetical protein
MTYHGVSEPVTEWSPDNGEVTVLPLEDWLRLLQNARSTAIRDLLMWEAELTGDRPAQHATKRHTGKPRKPIA